MEDRLKWSLRKKKKNYLNHYRRTSARKGWHFLTGDQESITKLASQVGYKYDYDKSINQYGHAAVLMMITPSAQISRYLYGIDFKHNDLKLALLEAAEGKIGTTIEQLLLFCFAYDPDSKSYSFTIMRLMQAAGLLTILSLVVYIVMARRKELVVN